MLWHSSLNLNVFRPIIKFQYHNMRNVRCMFLLVTTHPPPPNPLPRNNNLSQHTFGQKTFQTNGSLIT